MTLGHRYGAFCGDSLNATVNFRANSSIDNYRFVAEMRPLYEPKLSCRSSVAKVDVISQIRMKEEKSRTKIGGYLYEAEVKIVSRKGDYTVLDLSFNTIKCSWDYMWKSHRWSGPDTEHVVNIIVFEDVPGPDFLVTSDCISSSFRVASSHKPIASSSRSKRKSTKGASQGENTTPISVTQEEDSTIYKNPFQCRMPISLCTEQTKQHLWMDHIIGNTLKPDATAQSKPPDSPSRSLLERSMSDLSDNLDYCIESLLPDRILFSGWTSREQCSETQDSTIHLSCFQSGRCSLNMISNGIQLSKGRRGDFGLDTIEWCLWCESL